MAEGNLMLDVADADLTEALAGTNLNPGGAPWQGATDADNSDSYPNELAGIIDVAGNVTTRGGNAGQRQLCCRWLLATDGVAVEIARELAR